MHSGRLPRTSDLAAAPVSCRGGQTQDKEQAEAWAQEGRPRAVPVPKEQQEQGSDPWKGDLSLPKPPPPTWAHLSGHSLPSSQDSYSWPHTLLPQWPPDVVTGFLPESTLIHSRYAPLLTTTVPSQGNYILLREMQDMGCGSISLTVRKTCQKTEWRQLSPNMLLNNVPPPTEASY